MMSKSFQLKSKFLQRTVSLDVYTPKNLLGIEVINLLLVNDGQDLAKMDVEKELNKLYDHRTITPTILVGLTAGEERLQEYGVSNHPDYKKRGAKANLYSDFVTLELMPFIYKIFPYKITGRKAIAGFSLGGLCAFDLAWQRNGFFDCVGVFSGSFWWRSKALDDNYTDDDRILHRLIRETKTKPALNFWLMAGTADETADRNQNYIIDSIDDTVDVVKELIKKGYNKPDEVFYYEMVGGKHDVESWSKAFPHFLSWAFK
jgi:enterochelin esterase-like enzyme